MGHSKELNERKHDTVIECCCYKKSIYEISIPLKYFTVNYNWYCCNCCCGNFRNHSNSTIKCQTTRSYEVVSLNIDVHGL